MSRVTKVCPHKNQQFYPPGSGRSAAGAATTTILCSNPTGRRLRCVGFAPRRRRSGLPRSLNRHGSLESAQLFRTIGRHRKLRLARRQNLFFRLLDIALRVAALTTFFSAMLRTRSARLATRKLRK